MKIFLFTIIFYIICPIFVFSHNFKCFQIGPIFGYRQEEIDFGVQSPLIADPNATRENFDTFHVFEIGGNMELLIPCRIFLRGKSTVGFGSSSNAIIEARRRISDFSNTFIGEQRFQGRYHAKSNTLDSSVNIGFPLKLAPVTLLAYFGYGYDRENITRKSPPIFNIFENGVNFSFTPSKNLDFKYYSPLFGIGFHLKPDPCGMFKLMSEYQFYWGILDISSSYKSQTSDPTDFIIQKENLNLKKRGYSHRFFIQALMNLRCHLNIGLKLKYQYTSADPSGARISTSSQELINGVFTNQVQNERVPFNKFVWQYLGGEILFLLQF